MTGIPASAVASASYQATVQYFLSGTEKYRRTIPYFTAGDGNPLTMGDNAYEVTDTGATYPVKASFGGGGFVSEDLTAFGNLPNVAAAATRIDSPRFVEAFETASDGKTLTVRFIEFIRYDCLSGNHVKRERIFKIPLR
ncbi:MAG: hypothetical protein QG650_676 [Patescibacteria group bacterium]|nr:hypothetical protein [Patescibacteria group bacterium]